MHAVRDDTFQRHGIAVSRAYFDMSLSLLLIQTRNLARTKLSIRQQKAIGWTKIHSAVDIGTDRW